MCGIAGIYGQPDPSAVRAMIEAMRHRGPDDRGFYADDKIVLSQARLAIIDTSAGGHQPMASDNGLIQIVYNGEIYNFQAKRQLLESKGYTFKTASDTEVVLKLYEEYGEEFFSHLRGIFALAIYDKRSGSGREKLLLGRDPFGIKPLLYSKVGAGVVFASELKGLLSSGKTSRRIDPQALQQLLSLGSIYQPTTLVEGVFALPSAHYLRVDRAGFHLKRYWSYGLDRVGGLRQLPYQEQVTAFADALKESVKLQMIADVPVGAFLSGGVDSSLIVALMAREAGGHIKTYSVGFEEGAGAVDESHEAADIARLLETDHTRVVVTADDMLANFSRFIGGLDQPSVDGLNSYFVSQAAATGVTVSLSGTGGDELFLGYPWFAGVKNSLDSGRGAERSRVARLLSHFSANGRNPGSVGDLVDPSAFREAFGRQYHCFGPSFGYSLLSRHLQRHVKQRSFAEDLESCDEFSEAGLLDRSSVMCLNGYTRNQLLRDIDACSMTHSLEVRVPFLDTAIADFAFSLPVASKISISDRTLDPSASYSESGVKKIVCDVARRYLPNDFFDARAKRGFALPYADWMRGPLAEILEDTTSAKSVAQAGLFDPAAVARVNAEFHGGQRPWSHPWLLMITELWRRQVLAP
ncbi:asparagine synthase (glutamine-hydrolyzing) [Rhizobium anhuiense]|uniref:asparagine synthase (glutamine-hydrolyzing) n=1 Tax=Rhizobium anhuiense TaxID=1184720 RepID=A0ABX4IZA8_9HYPH|nr:asparagine synthase (glutamine-hydrolyzing) [Rhizobium anhuiense]PDS40639.1 asparagine synthase (glutamine-hydrolyzing) [Rhizobium anhuiense]PDS47566.1 asparagine synthase (glutamine-hydrolyzing) [Rhizobium anhuiense]